MRILWRWFKKFTKYCFALFLLIVLLLSGLLWYTTTESFQQMVRRRLVADIESATGGRVEVGSFHVVPLHFQVEVRGLTIHGREAADQLPYVHVDSMVATVNLSAALGARISFHSLVLNRPVVHIVFYPDGTSNVPVPRQQTQAVDFQHLFSISVNRLDVRRGELLYQDQRLPLEFSSNDVSANVYYSFLHRRFSGKLAIGRAESTFDGYRPVAWAGKSDFAADRNGIEIKSLEANSGATKVHFKGTVNHLQAPVVSGTYEIGLDLAQLGAVARQPHLKGGVVSLAGTESWSAQTFSANGKFDLRSFSWQDSDVNVHDALMTANYSLDPQRLSFYQVDGEVARGKFAGDAEVNNWQSQPKQARSKGEQVKSEQAGVVKLKIKDFSVADVLASLGSNFRPENKLKLAGNASGTVEMRWRTSIENADAAIALDVTRPSRLQTGQIPLTASMHTNYNVRTGNLAISDLAANTPATQIRASGNLSSSLKLSVVTNDMREWQPVTNELFPDGMPFDLHGSATFNGTVSGKLANLAIVGNAQVSDFDLAIPATSHSTRGRVHGDSLNSDVQLSSGTLTLHNAVLRHNDAVVRLDGSAQLRDWLPDASSTFHARVQMQNVDSGEVATLLGYGNTISGKLAGGFEVSGIASQPRGRGSFNLAQGSVRGYPVDSATASVSINGDEIGFQNATLSHGYFRLTAQGTYDRRLRRTQLDVNGSNFEIADLPELRGLRISIKGTLDFSAKVSGPTANPDVNASLHLRHLTLNGEEAGDYFVNAVSHGPDLRVTGHSDFKDAELLLDGNIRTQERWPSLIDVQFTRLDIDSVLQTYLHGHVTGHSAAAGNLRIEGPLLDPKQLKLTGNVSDLFADVEQVKIRNEGPIRFSVENQLLKLDDFHIVGENTDLRGGGAMQFGADRALDFHATGSVGLQVLRAYNPDFTTSGAVTADAQITGTLNAPLVQGKLQVKGAAISDINLPSALSELNGTLLFNQSRVTIESLSAKTGGGTVNLTGHADVSGRQLSFDLTANATDVRFRYPPGVSSTATAELHWTGSTAGSVLSGDVTITKLGFTPGFDFGTYLERTAQINALPQTDPVLNKIRLDLHVVTAPELQMQTSVIRLQGEADLHVRGNAAKPVILGRADVFEGEAYFNGTKYRLERGGVTFNNPALTTPILDLQASTRVRDYEVTLSMTGPASSPKLNYRSDPPLPPSDIIALLAFGQTSEQSAQLQQNSSSAFSSQTSNALLAAALNATLNNRAQRLFGNTHIKIDPQGLVTETSLPQNSPAVTIEQQVKDNLTLTYTTAVAQTSQQVIRAEYNITRNVSVVAIRDQNGIVSFDVKIRRRHR
jgi:translocation and assembly module TamB